MLELEPNLPDEDLAAIIEEVDEDGSGTIDFDGKRSLVHRSYGVDLVIYLST